MRVDYEISEVDYLNAQRLAIKRSPNRYVRWTRLFIPGFGLVLLTYVVIFALIVPKQALSIRNLPGLVVPIAFMSMPLLNKRKQKKLYAKSTSLHGKLSLIADGDGLEFQGSTFQSRANWSVFDSFFEDKDSFVLYQKTQVFNMLPKRGLSKDDIQELSQLLRMRIGS
jgi:YcxB-like protein